MKIRNFSWMPAVAIMVTIFIFSAKPAVSSNESSMIIVDQIVSIYQNVTNTQYEPERMEHIKEVLNFIVRKSAHFSEYALLAVAAAFHLYVRKRKGLVLYFLPVLTVFLYASTDEFHQTFVPGRTGLFRDVLIDTAGGATGSLIFTLIVIFMIGRAKRKRAVLKA